MSQRRKIMSTKQHRWHLPWQRLALFAVVSMVVGIGTYYIARSAAQLDVPDNAIVISGVGNDASTNYSYESITTQKIDFNKRSVPLFFLMPTGVYATRSDHDARRLSQPASWHVSLRMGFNVKVTGIDCAPGYSCQTDQSDYSPGYQPAINAGQVQSLYMCINLSQQDYGKNMTLLTINVDPGTTAVSPQGRDWIVIATAEQDDCLTLPELSRATYPEQPNNHSHDHQTYGSYGGYAPVFNSWSFGIWGASPSRTGGGSPTPGKAVGTGGTGTGSDGNGNGSGGGTNGSTANTQSNDSNPLPQSSAQGGNSPSTIVPSPFYDGKEYEPGSETDDHPLTAIFSGEQKPAALGITTAGVVFLVASGVALFWRFRHPRSKPLRRKATRRFTQMGQ